MCRWGRNKNKKKKKKKNKKKKQVIDSIAAKRGLMDAVPVPESSPLGGRVLAIRRNQYPSILKNIARGNKALADGTGRKSRRHRKFKEATHPSELPRRCVKAETHCLATDPWPQFSIPARPHPPVRKTPKPQQQITRAIEIRRSGTAARAQDAAISGASLRQGNWRGCCRQYVAILSRQPPLP